MTGIYKITNKLNGHAYIGMSTNIEQRWETHCKPSSWKREPTKALYLAFQKYGLANFSFAVLEECTPEELSDKEKFYIDFYDTYSNGYNNTYGGEGFSEEAHPNHKLTKADVIDIRMRYDNLERKKDVYKLYCSKIGESGFNKIWSGITWKQIMPEVYTSENKRFHAHDTSMAGSNNGRARLTEEDVRNIRLRRKRGELLSTVYSDYQNRMTYKSFANVWSYQNWKTVIV